MSFDGEDGAKTFLPHHPGKFLEGKTSVPQREMFVRLTMIVMEMYLSEKGSHGINPVGKRFPGKHVEMPCIKTKSTLR